MRFSRWSIVLVLAVLAGCAATPETGKDRYGLAAQKDVYVIKFPIQATFAVHRYGKSFWLAGPLNSTSRLIEKHSSANLQEKLGLEDPTQLLADRLAESLRRDLGLTNLRVVPGLSHPRVIPSRRVDEPTFRDTHASGFAIQVQTREWGLEDYKMKYYATVRVFDLAASKEVLAKNCPVVMFEQVDRDKLPLPPSGPQFGNNPPDVVGALDAAVEEKLFADNGAMIKANLRKAVEQCADSIAAMFLGKS